MTLTFDDRTHVYALDGVEIPSVTAILAATGLLQLNGVDPELRAAAMARGTRVHAAIHGLTGGRLDEGIPISPDEQGYVDAALTFLDESRSVALLSEHRVFHPRHRYAGTIDCVARGDLGYVLIDWKTTINPTALAADLQLAAYSEALRANPPALLTGWKPTDPMTRLGVSLRADGSYFVWRYNDPRDFGVFIHALAIYSEQQRRRVALAKEDAA